MQSMSERGQVDHLPRFRQAGIFARQGVHLGRSTLAKWLGRVAYELTPVYECLKADLKQSTKLFTPSQQIAAQSPAG
jgi:transposase